MVVSVSAGSGVGSQQISHEGPAVSLRFAAINFRIASCASFMRSYGPLAARHALELDGGNPAAHYYEGAHQCDRHSEERDQRSTELRSEICPVNSGSVDYPRHYFPTRILPGPEQQKCRRLFLSEIQLAGGQVICSVFGFRWLQLRQSFW